MPLEPGTRLGPYTVEAPVGAGGMGEVYRARDTKLNRDVAIKVLPPMFATDRDRLIRFEREAQTLAALNHPNIAQVFGVIEDPAALVMEFVGGEDLSQRLARGAMPLDEALAVAAQIADALAAAHERGIIHRDLKPANIKVRPDGAVKVLDFGLAKAMTAEGSAPASAEGLRYSGATVQDAVNSPTFTSPAMTQLGMILGTAAYMAPEQAKGRAVDRRADVWAFGVVLLEMLTGRRAFGGDDVSDVLASVLKDAPPLDALPAETPQAVRRLLRRCLEKDRSKRLDSMADARLEIDEALQGGVGDGTLAVVPARRLGTGRTMALVLAIAAAAAAIAGASVWRLTRPEASPLRRMAITPPLGVTLETEANHADVAVASDGASAVYWNRIGQNNQISLRRFDRFESVPLAGLDASARGLFVSPDGAWVGFQTGDSQGTNSTLMKTATAGGSPMVITGLDSNLRGASWGDDDRILFATSRIDGGILRVRAAGGDSEVLTKAKGADGELDHQWPHLLPGAAHALFVIARIDGTSDIGLLDVEARAWRVLVKDGTMPRFVDGYIVYATPAALRAVRFDLARLAVTGDPVQLPYDVMTKDSGAASFDISRDGTLVYRPGGNQLSVVGLAWADRIGNVTPLGVEARSYRALRVSPDGRKVAATIEEDGEMGLWVIDLERETLSRVTPAGFWAAAPAWSPDSRSLAVPLAVPLTHGDTRTHSAGLFRVAAAGTTPPERLTAPVYPVRHTSPNWSPDGREILFVEFDGPRIDIMRLGLSDGKVEAVLNGPAAEGSPTLSPDGRWLAYQTDDSGRRDVFVRPYPDTAQDRIPISVGGGTTPAWSNTGRELFFLDAQRTPMSVSVAPGAALSPGRPVRIPAIEGSLPFSYAMAPDGSRLLQQTPPKDGPAVPNEFRVVFNFLAELGAVFKQ